jgi:hypothetical protein
MVGQSRLYVGDQAVGDRAGLSAFAVILMLPLKRLCMLQKSTAESSSKLLSGREVDLHEEKTHTLLCTLDRQKKH